MYTYIYINLDSKMFYSSIQSSNSHIGWLCFHNAKKWSLPELNKSKSDMYKDYSKLIFPNRVYLSQVMCIYINSSTASIKGTNINSKINLTNSDIVNAN